MWVSIPGYGKAKINAGLLVRPVRAGRLDDRGSHRRPHRPRRDHRLHRLRPARRHHRPDHRRQPGGVGRHDDRGVQYKFPKGPLVITDGLHGAGVRSSARGASQRGPRPYVAAACVPQGVALKIATPEVLANPVKLNAVIATIGKYVTVDSGMTNDVIYSLALSLTGITSASQIHMVQAPITGFGMSQTASRSTSSMSPATPRSARPCRTTRWPRSWPRTRHRVRLHPVSGHGRRSEGDGQGRRDEEEPDLMVEAKRSQQPFHTGTGLGWPGSH
jgi:hypothetical protein